ncbi:MAG: hypothetical protein PHT19_08585 [Methylococcus sp.]|nr:hypothetical protein [Methylococcus sp.]
MNRWKIAGGVWFAVSGLLSSQTTQGSGPVFTESFEQAGAIPSGWRLIAWLPQVSAAAVESAGGAQGQHFLVIRSVSDNHARLAYTVPVEPHAYYRWHAAAKALPGAPGKAAAVIGLDGAMDTSESVADADGWHPLDFYFATGDTASVTLTVGLGHFGQTNRGAAYFDDLSLEKIDRPPAGARIASAPYLPSPTPLAASASAHVFGAGPSHWLYVLAGFATAAAGYLAVSFRLTRPR